MWFFKRKKSQNQSWIAVPLCPGCHSRNTKLVIRQNDGAPEYVKVWRGKRSLTYRCSDCGLDFYIDEPLGGIEEESLSEGRTIDDEDALKAAEEEIKRQIDEENDRRYK
jgi:hypothetical protein